MLPELDLVNGKKTARVKDSSTKMYPYTLQHLSTLYLYILLQLKTKY